MNKIKSESEKLWRWKIATLILTIKESTKIRNAFANNISEDIKLSKPHVSKIIQSGGPFGSWLSNLGKKKALTNVAISLAKDILPGLVSNLALQ